MFQSKHYRWIEDMYRPDYAANIQSFHFLQNLHDQPMSQLEYPRMVQPPPVTRVLIVDDDPQERNSLSTKVSALGYAVETAEHGEEALEKLGSSIIDIIITDLMMPRMDGTQLLQELVTRGDLTPVIVLTSLGSVDKAVSIVKDFRAFWYLEKPAQLTGSCALAGTSCPPEESVTGSRAAPPSVGLSGGPRRSCGHLGRNARRFLGDSAGSAQFRIRRHHRRKRHRQGTGRLCASQTESQGG